MNLITTNELCKRYGDKLVIDHVNMHIPEAAIYGFIGENGSGKTTIMRLLTGLAEPTSGSFTMFGVGNKDADIYKARKKLSAIVEKPSLIPSLTAKDNIHFIGIYLGIKLTDEEIDALLKKVHLEEVGKKKVGNFSLGMRQRLGIALALINHPKLMFLDEPMNGLDPEGIAELRELLVELNKSEGITIVISSHILSELEKIATCYGFISHGKIIEEISTEELHSRCRKSLTIKVDNVPEAKKVLEQLNIRDYKESATGEIKITEEVKINDMVTALSAAGVMVSSMSSSDETVEDYYLNLVRRGE